MTQVLYGERLGKNGELRIGCSATVFDERRQKVLLTRRRDNGLWCLPGGYMESGESVTLQSGDVLLLGSDGLWGPFSDEEFAEAFAAQPVTDALDKLIAHALKREDGRSDNVTGLAMRWGSGETAHDTAEPVCHILEI